MSEETNPKALLMSLESRAKRKFGQHFLTRSDVVSRIVRASGVREGSRVVEVGPGLGIMTAQLLEAGVKLLAVEIDRDLAARLREVHPALDVREADATRIAWSSVLEGAGWSLVSNLPYNVGTQILMDVLRAPATFSHATVMLQAEVVGRLLAEPGSKVYGALSVERWLRAEGRVVMGVGPRAFYPPPKVDSTVANFDILPEPRTEGLEAAFVDSVVRAAFSQRRKTLRNALSTAFGRDRASAALALAGIRGEDRAEVVEQAAYVALARAMAESA